MVIRWTLLARKTLHDVYLFYLPTAGEKKAKEIAQQIKDETKYLVDFLQLGVCAHINNEITPYRYLVKGNFKTYYTIHETHIRIAFVWDTRRNPELLAKYL